MVDQTASQLLFIGYGGIRKTDVSIGGSSNSEVLQCNPGD